MLSKVFEDHIELKNRTDKKDTEKRKACFFKE